MAETQSFDLVIVGGGVVGCTLALLAAQSEFSVAVVDAKPGDNKSEDPRNYAIVRGSWRLLSGIGLDTAVSANATVLHGLEAEDGGQHFLGIPRTLFSDSDLDSDIADEPLGRMVRARALEDAASAAARTDKRIHWFAPDRFRARQTDTGGITISLQSGETLRAPLLAGCDGMNSPVRDACAIQTVGWEYDQAVITLDVGLSQHHNGIARQVFTSEGPFAILPLQGDRANLAWYMPRRAAESLVRMPRSDIEAELNHRHADWAGHMTVASDPLTYPLRLRLAETLVAERTALLGDAVRRISPIAGQGLNSGLKDAAALIEVMEDARGVGLDWGRAEFLSRYEQWRRPDTVGVTLAMDAMARGFRMNGLVTKPLKSLALMAANGIDPVRRMLARQASSDQSYLPRRMRPHAAAALHSD